MSGRCEDVGTFAPCEDVSRLMGQGASVDAAVYLCAQYYGFCAAVGGGDWRSGNVHVDGWAAHGYGFGRCGRAAAGRAHVASGVGRGDAEGDVDVEVGAGTGVGVNFCCGVSRFLSGGSAAASGSGSGKVEPDVAGSAGVGDTACGGSQASGSGGFGGAGAGTATRETCEEVEVSEKTLANREKRRKAKAAKLRKQAEARVRKQEEAKVPEWRRNGGVGVHKGAFAECSQDTQLALRESRAQMLIAKNKAAVIEAEERARKTAAMLKSRMVEENVEKERLELEKKMKVLRESAAMPQGYCETVLSALATPSLSDGTVSPDSSISSAEVHKKDEAIKMLVNQCDEQRKIAEKSQLKQQETEQKLQATIKRLEALEASTNAARRAREEAARERVRREREEMFGGKQAGEGWAGVRGARNVGKTEHNIDGTTKIVWSTDAEV